MLLSLKWLREFVPYTGTAEELGNKLTMLGLELDELCRPYAELEDLIVGYITECAQHPDADKLSVCKVDVGTEVLDIVCGAPNVAKGQYVVVAPVGATLPGGLKIKKAKLRGAPSNGMICSERELGLSDDHSGIMVLQDLLEGPFTPGAKAIDTMGLDTEVLDISITPNRPDCLSVLGFAREVAMAYNLPLTLPPLNKDGVEFGSEALNGLSLEVENAGIAPFYQLRAIEGVKVGKSPAWLRWRLNACGQRSISNIVDVTNYVMLELGQPLHCFDFSKVKGGKVRVARATDGEKHITLDGQERTLTSRDITIRDAERAIGLGGVMGGENSEIDEASGSVMLEGAVFNTSSIRHTAKRLNIPSEASYRFERGVDQGMTAYALERAALLIARLGQGKMSNSALTSELQPVAKRNITLRKDRAEQLIGVPLSADFCSGTLSALGCVVKEAASANSGLAWVVTPPSYRSDLEREADLIEELARVYGVDRIPETLPAVTRNMSKASPLEPKHKFFARVKKWAAGLGLNEAVNYSFVGNKDLDFLGIASEGRVNITNPLSAELDVLRTCLAPGLLNTLRNNLSHGASGLRIFEIAAGFSKDTAKQYSDTGVREQAILGLMVYGERFSTAWPQKAEDMDYLDLKGFVENFAAWLGLAPLEFKTSTSAPAWLKPAVDIMAGSTLIGTMGRVKPDMAQAFHAKKDVWLAEIKLDIIYELALAIKPGFTSLQAFPPVRRDITVIAPLNLESATIITAIGAAKAANLQGVTLVDLYQPKDQAQRNLTYRLTFRHAERTLQDAEVDKERDKVAKYLVDKLQVKI
ncbi:phenylalanine--tRNA ligase subunit beta [Desulfovibrio sp. OttesenSCG-928-F07]|nr:phenylalanine--tRNA ligase subunit beta [Desulfovibrio sp. OttesenSCG-928-F07]